MNKLFKMLRKKSRPWASASAGSWADNLVADERGAITIVAALALPAVIGVVALAVEFGNALLIRDETQRVADEAAYAGALAYVATGSQTSMLSAAQNVAASERRRQDRGDGEPRDLAAHVDGPGGSGHHHDQRTDRFRPGPRVWRQRDDRADVLRRDTVRRAAVHPCPELRRVGRFALRRNQYFGAELRSRLASVDRRALRRHYHGQGRLLQRLGADGRMLRHRRDRSRRFPARIRWRATRRSSPRTRARSRTNPWPPRRCRQCLRRQRRDEHTFGYYPLLCGRPGVQRRSPGSEPGP